MYIQKCIQCGKMWNEDEVRVTNNHPEDNKIEEFLCENCRIFNIQQEEKLALTKGGVR